MHQGARTDPCGGREVTRAPTATEAKRWIDCQPDFATSRYVNGFAWPDGKFRFKPDWPNVPFRSPHRSGPVDAMPPLPGYWEVIEEADAAHPFRRAPSHTML